MITRLSKRLKIAPRSQPPSLTAHYATKFNWRASHYDQAPPTVELVSCPFEANEILDSIRSSRLTCHIDFNEIREGPGLEISAPGTIGVLALADKDGVVVLHLEAMKQAPTLLKSILESDSIVKQAFGAGSLQRWFYEEYDRFNIHPHQLLDLRLLALKLFPDLFPGRHKNVSHGDFIKLAANALLDLDISSTTAGQYRWDVVDLTASPALEYMVNSTWCQHILGLILAEALKQKTVEMSKTLAGTHALRQLMYDVTYTTHDITLLEKLKASGALRR